jgi:hypothetical protein
MTHEEIATKKIAQQNALIMAERVNRLVSLSVKDTTVVYGTISANSSIETVDTIA